jgi:hypothetical protein
MRSFPFLSCDIASSFRIGINLQSGYFQIGMVKIDPGIITATERHFRAL